MYLHENCFDYLDILLGIYACFQLYYDSQALSNGSDFREEEKDREKYVKRLICCERF